MDNPNGREGSLVEQVLYEVKKTIVGQDVLLERLLVALVSRGHILVEGVPGLAKTLAVKSLAQAIGGDFHRVQFTPDLVPADIVGTRVYHQPTGEFLVQLGPVFTNLLLADDDFLDLVEDPLHEGRNLRSRLLHAWLLHVPPARTEKDPPLRPRSRWGPRSRCR